MGWLRSAHVCVYSIVWYNISMEHHIGLLTKRRMIRKAKSIHGKITPCHMYKRLTDCFTCDAGVIMLWFNDKTGNTKVIQEPIK